MSHSPRLFLKPLAETPPPSLLSVTGAFPKYALGNAYTGRIQINNSVGKCKVTVIEHATLPAGYLVYVDNVTKEVVVTWPKSELTPVTQHPVNNGSFEDGLNGWLPITPGWDVVTGDAIDLTKKARCINAKREMRLRSAPVPAGAVGTPINLGIMVQQGASSKGNAGGAAELVFLRGDGSVLETHQGNVIMSASNGAWYESRLLRQVPEGAVYVAAQCYCIRKRQNRGVYFDKATWDHRYKAGSDDAMPIWLHLRVTDADNSTADWTGYIVSYSEFISSSPYPVMVVGEDSLSYSAEFISAFTAVGLFDTYAGPEELSYSASFVSAATQSIFREYVVPAEDHISYSASFVSAVTKSIFVQHTVTPEDFLQYNASFVSGATKTILRTTTADVESLSYSASFVGASTNVP